MLFQQFLLLLCKVIFKNKLWKASSFDLWVMLPYGHLPFGLKQMDKALFPSRYNYLCSTNLFIHPVISLLHFFCIWIIAVWRHSDLLCCNITSMLHAKLLSLPQNCNFVCWCSNKLWTNVMNDDTHYVVCSVKKSNSTQLTHEIILSI